MTTPTTTMTGASSQDGREDLPHALTFFLTGAQRRAVLARLRRHNSHDRAEALLRALRLDDRKGGGR